MPCLRVPQWLKLLRAADAAKAEGLWPEWSILERPFASADILACLPNPDSKETVGLYRRRLGKTAMESEDRFLP